MTASSITGKIIMNSSANNSETDNPVNYPLYALVLLFTVIAIGIVGNFLLIIAHVKDPLKLIKSSSSCFIFNIALVDLLLLCSYILIMFTVTDSRIRYLTESLISLLYSVSFTLYLSLAIQRFCSIAIPLWHHVHITTRVCRYWVTTIWLSHIVMNVGLVVVIVRTDSEVKVRLAILVVRWLTFFVTICVYVASCLSLRKQSRELQSRHDMNAETEWTTKIRLENEKNFMVTIAIICLFLGVLVLPFLTFSFLIILNAMAGSEKVYKGITPYYDWILLAYVINSAINVFVYIWRLPKYRKTFKKLYCDC